MGPVWDFDRSAGVITDDSTASSSSGWRLRGIGSTHNPNNKTHWHVQLFMDPAFLDAVEARWAEKCSVYKAVGQTGAQAAADSMGVGASNEVVQVGEHSTPLHPEGHHVPGRGHLREELVLQALHLDERSAQDPSLGGQRLLRMVA